MKILFVDRNELNKIINLSDIDKNMEKTLYESGIITINSQKDQEVLNYLKKEYRKTQKEIGLLYLIVSQCCNLKCTYCFLENEYGNWKNLIMSQEVAKKAIDEFLSHTQAVGIVKPTIMLYGGEPLLNWEVVKYSVKYAYSQNRNVEFSIVTNGTFINDDIAEFFKNYNIKISISIDGYKDITDKNRIFKNNLSKSVYDLVMKSIDILDKYKCNYGFSMTLNKDLLEHTDETIMWLKSKNVKSIFFNLMHYSNKDVDWEYLLDKSIDFLIKSHKELSPYAIFDGRIMRQINSFCKNEMKVSDCAAVGVNQIAVNPSGEVRICHGNYEDKENLVGNIMTQSLDFILKNANFDSWINKVPLMRQECEKCDAIYICGGGCPYQAKILFGQGKLDLTYCKYCKSVLDWLLEYGFNKLDKMEGL